MEQLVNGAGQSTLASSIGSGDTSLTVADASVFPSTGTFRIRIGAEILKVTAVAGATFTVERGAETTAASPHTAGDFVDWSLTAGGYEDFFAEYVSKGPWAARPAGSFAGQIYISTDSVYLSRFNGTVWEEFGPVQIHKVNTTGFAQVNGGTLTNKGALYLDSAATTNDDIHAYTKAYTAPATLIAKLDWNFNETDFGHAGVCFRDSGSGKLACHGVLQNSSISRFFGQKFNGPLNAYASDYGAFGSSLNYMRFNAQMSWMRLVDDGVNRVWSVSPNGRDWLQLHTVIRTDFLTPTEMGVFVKASNNVAASIRVTFLEMT